MSDGVYMRILAAAKEPQHVRQLPDGRALYLNRMIFTWRLSIGDPDQGHVHDFWCYKDERSAVKAFRHWIPSAEEPEPPGWTKHKATGRVRINGDPAKEYSAKGPPPEWAKENDE